jgi:phage terminase large subunit-like protein
MATTSPARAPSTRSKPFTVDHFRGFARNSVLDNGDYCEPEDFQLFAVEDLFAGATEVWLVVPEGNGKTTITGLVALYYAHLIPGAMVALGAASRDQCGLLLGQAAGFVYRTPGLSKRFRVFEGYRRITSKVSGGKIQVYAADDRTGDGLILDLALLDELHRQRDLRLYRTWAGKLDKKGGQLLGISTGGEPDSEFEQIRSKMRTEATDVKRERCYVRAAGGGMVLHDYFVPAGEDVEDMEVVKAANPFSKVTTETLRRKRDRSTMTLAHWRRFVCNQAVRGTESAITESELEDVTTDDLIPEGEPIWAGLDLAWKFDTTAIAPVWLPSFDERLFGAPKILTPPRDGTMLHPSKVREAFEEIHARNPIEVVVMDMRDGAETATWLMEDLGVRVVEHSNKPDAMALAYERWMEGMREGWIKVSRDPEFARHILNAVARLMSNGRTRFDRSSSSRSPSMQDRRVWDALDAAHRVNSVAAGELRATIDPDAYRIDFL